MSKRVVRNNSNNPYPLEVCGLQANDFVFLFAYYINQPDLQELKRCKSHKKLALRHFEIP